jgi:hypothetical protein
VSTTDLPTNVGSNDQLGPTSTDVDLWAEIHRLRAGMAGPAGCASWKDAATAERVLRVKTQIAFGRLADVAEERARQDAKWGGAEHDDHHTTAEFVQLIADSVEGQRTVECAFTEKMRAHAIVTQTSSWEQKTSQGAWGAIFYRPAFVVSYLGA